MDKEIKAVIFDIGGVITKFPDHEYVMYLANLSGKSPAAISSAITQNLPAFEKGRMRTRDFVSAIAKRLGVSPDEIQWYQYYEKFVTVDQDVTDLVAELHKEYITAYITNIDASKYVLFKKMLGQELFDYRFASCDLHLRKPDPRIYETVLKRMGLDPREAVFIDNQKENVRGAMKVGIYSILYKSRRLLDIELSRILE